MNILITGSKGGLGYQYAKDLAKRGHIVYASVKTEQEKISLEEKCRKEHVILFPIILDLEDEKTYQVLDLYTLDVLILQAGIGEGGSLLEISEERLLHNFSLNVVCNLSLIKRFIYHCIKDKRKGKIIITSSLAAFLPLPYLGSYTISKISLYQLAKTLKLELQYQNIDVSVSLILPGAYRTGFNQLMIENKTKNKYLFPVDAINMTKWQKMLFFFLESKNLKTLSKKLVMQVECKHPSFSISAPFFQKIVTKIYRIFSILLDE